MLTTENSTVKVASLPLEVAGDEQREDGLEVVGQRADHGHHHQRHEQLGHAAHVAQAGPHLALGPGRDRRGAQLGRAHHPQPGQHGDVGQAVAEEGPAVADRRHQQAGQRRAHHPGRGHERAVQADGVVDLRRAAPSRPRSCAGRGCRTPCTRRRRPPRRRARRGAGSPLKASAASTNDCTMASAWTTSSSLRLSERSATRPAHGPEQQHGPELGGGQHARAPRRCR